MEKKEKIKLAVLGGGVLLLILLANRATAGANGSDGQSYDIPSASEVLNAGNPGFTSVINVNADPTQFGVLSDQYVPLFGMVGVGVTGSLPREINATAVSIGVIQGAPVSPAVVAAANPPKSNVTVSAPSVRPDGYYNLTGASARRLTAY